jgi:FkbM family methyltransferase
VIAALHRLTSHRAIMPLTARVICARLVRESPRFLAGELLRPRGVHAYHLRDNGRCVLIRHRGVDAATLAEVFYHRFYDPPAEVARAIGEPQLILDLGANIGLFGLLASSRWPSARIVGYEPDPANAAVHERAIEANGLGDRWTLVAEAAGPRDGKIRFVAGLGAGSHALGTATEAAAATIVVAQRDVLAAIAAADLVKIDIEGGEWELLGDPRFAAAPPRVLVIEYHPEGSPEADSRAAVERALAAAGLLTAPIWHAADGVGMLWAWRPPQAVRADA